MGEINDYSVTAASNNAASPDGMPEGMNSSGVNNAWREHAARHKRHYLDNNGSIVTAGTSTAYTCTLNQQFSAWFNGLTFAVRFNQASGASPTINPTGSGALGAKSLVMNDGTAPSSGSIAANAIVQFQYNSTTDKVHILSVLAEAAGEAAASTTVAGIVELATTAETTTGTDGSRAVTPDGLHDMTSLAGAAWFLDEDAMGSDSATKVASQQSVKAYVDTQVAAVSQLTPDTALATTSGTTKDFTIPAGANRVTVILDGVTGSGTDNQLIQLGDSGGIEATGYTSISDTAGTNVTSTAGFIIRTPSAAAFSGHMVLTRVTGNVWIASHTGNFAGSGSPDGGGTKTVSAELTTVRVAWTGSDTFSAGQTNVFVE